MLRKYSKLRIYKNLVIVKKLSNIALILGVALALMGVLQFIIIKKNIEIWKYFNITLMISYEWLFLLPLSIRPILGPEDIKKAKIAEFREENKQVLNNVYLGETRFNNDYFITLMKIILTISPYCCIIIFELLGTLFDSDLLLSITEGIAFVCGRTLISHIFIYIADIFLIYNCVLIKREWKLNPPEFIKLEKEDREQVKQEKTLNLAKQLLSRCGFKFFIKYYNQIKLLPMRDVEVVESYENKEKLERLSSVKTIIDSNLTAVVVNEILKNYNEFLTEDDKVELNKIMATR